MSNAENISAEDLAALPLKELKALEKKVAKAIATFETRQKQAALAALEEKAKEMGFSLAELTGAIGGGRGKVKSVGVPKYANPENPAQTWTGKGRRPEWFVVAMAAGKSPEELAL